MSSVVLVGAAINFQETFKNIISKSKKIYENKGDSQNLKYISMLKQMDTNSIQYASYSFMHAMQNGFYSPSSPSNEAKAIYSSMSINQELMKYAAMMDRTSPSAWQNTENYTLIDIKEDLKKIRSKGINVFALYGNVDGLFSAQQVEELKGIVGKDNLKYLDNCSHNVFIDQQNLFIENIKSWIK